MILMSSPCGGGYEEFPILPAKAGTKVKNLTFVTKSWCYSLQLFFYFS